MSQAEVCLFNCLTTAQVVDIQSRAATIDLTSALNTLFASGNKFYAPAGLYRQDTPLTTPLTGPFTLRGDGPLTEFRAYAAMPYQFSKETLANGADNSPVFLDDFYLNANRLADWSLRIGASKGGRVNNIKTRSFLVGGGRCGNENGVTSGAYYENDVNKFIADGDAACHPASSPAYGLLLNEGATDNFVTMPVASYLDLASGVGVRNKGAANIIVGAHTYCSAYNVMADVFCEIIAPYSDTMQKAGLRINADGVFSDGGMYYWPVGSPPALLADGGAIPIEIADGVNIVNITPFLVRNDNPANPYIKCLGARPTRLSCNGAVPARNPLTNLSGDRTAHLWENSLGVRSPSPYVTAAVDIAGPLSGKALVQFAKNDELRYTFGTDGTNKTGVGNAGENLELRVILDDQFSFLALRFDRGTKTWTLSDSAVIGTASGGLAFYGGPKVNKQIGTPANATDLATAITLVNSLKAKIVALGLIS